MRHVENVWLESCVCPVPCVCVTLASVQIRLIKSSLSLVVVIACDALEPLGKPPLSIEASIRPPFCTTKFAIKISWLKTFQFTVKDPVPGAGFFSQKICLKVTPAPKPIEFMGVPSHVAVAGWLPNGLVTMQINMPPTRPLATVVVVDKESTGVDPELAVYTVPVTVGANILVAVGKCYDIKLVGHFPINNADKIPEAGCS